MREKNKQIMRAGEDSVLASTDSPTAPTDSAVRIVPHASHRFKNDACIYCAVALAVRDAEKPCELADL